jgi:hypothetical protein
MVSFFLSFFLSFFELVTTAQRVSYDTASIIVAVREYRYETSQIRGVVCELAQEIGLPIAVVVSTLSNDTTRHDTTVSPSQ